MGRRRLADHEALLIRRSGGIHTWFMRFAIDVVFLAGDGTAVRIVERLRPWRIACARRARDVLELPAGKCGEVGLRAGDRLELSGSPS